MPMPSPAVSRIVPLVGPKAVLCSMLSVFYARNTLNAHARRRRQNKVRSFAEEKWHGSWIAGKSSYCNGSQQGAWTCVRCSASCRGSPGDNWRTRCPGAGEDGTGNPADDQETGAGCPYRRDQNGDG